MTTLWRQVAAVTSVVDIHILVAMRDLWTQQLPIVFQKGALSASAYWQDSLACWYVLWSELNQTIWVEEQQLNLMIKLQLINDSIDINDGTSEYATKIIVPLCYCRCLRPSRKDILVISCNFSEISCIHNSWTYVHQLHTEIDHKHFNIPPGYDVTECFRSQNDKVYWKTVISTKKIRHRLIDRQAFVYSERGQMPQKEIYMSNRKDKHPQSESQNMEHNK